MYDFRSPKQVMFDLNPGIRFDLEVYKNKQNNNFVASDAIRKSNMVGHGSSYGQNN